MTYEQYNWVDGEVITEERLNHMEKGISSACTSGNMKQVSGYDSDGNQVPVTLGIDQFSDVGGFPSFLNGVLTATGINQDDKTALIMFLEFSIDQAKKNTFPMYTNNATLKVADGIADDDAVSMNQYKELLIRVTELEKI